jgi:cysteine desulfurase
MKQQQQQQQQQQQTLITLLGGCATAATAYYLYSLWRNSNKNTNTNTDTNNYSNKAIIVSAEMIDSSGCIYLDYNGTTPIYPDVLDAMMPYLTSHYGNPSSAHIHGKEPRRAIDQARRQLLNFLGKDSKTEDNDNLSAIWFTGCGTESDNLAIALALQSHHEKKKTKSKTSKKQHIVTCNVEHPAIEGYLKNLESQGLITVSYVPVLPDGRVPAEDIIKAFTDDTILVTLMLANNESGALQPVQAVAEACRNRGILCHTDAAQAAGKVHLDTTTIGDADMISVVGHKLGAPKGIACLYVRPGCINLPHSHGVLLIGGGQEFGRRGGTENTPYIVGFGVAAELAQEHLEANKQHMEAMRGRLLKNLQAQLGEENVRANGPEDPALRLPNTLSVGIRRIHSGDLLADIGHLVAASAGATCHSAAGVSSVLRAMKVPEAFARGTLRLSLGPKTKPEEIDRAAKIISDAVKRQWESCKDAASQ